MNATLQIDPANPPAVYEWVGPTGVKFRDVRERSGTYYHDTTPRRIIALLEGAMMTGQPVRLFYGDRETGHDWLEEHDVCGRVGRSTGWLKTALLVAPGADGGGAIVADSIVRMFVDGCEVYRHPGYQVPEIMVGSYGPPSKLPFGAFVNGETSPHARFKTYSAAKRWAAFMRGERMRK